jgi:hypothetical protein
MANPPDGLITEFKQGRALTRSSNSHLFFPLCQLISQVVIENVLNMVEIDKYRRFDPSPPASVDYRSQVMISDEVGQTKIILYLLSDGSGYSVRDGAGP